jgi:hypothetical protein
MTEPINRDEKQFQFLQRIETGDTALTAYEPTTLEGAMALAKVISRSGLCPDALKNKDADVLVVLMRGKEMGLSAIQSLQNLHVIYGKIGMSADLMRARCQSHPDCVRFEIVSADDKQATVEILKAGWPQAQLVTFTMDEARKAGLVKTGGGYEKWTQDMLVARATSRAGRRYFPSVVAGLYTPEELSTTNGGDPEPEKPVSRTRALVAKLQQPKVKDTEPTIDLTPEPTTPVLPAEPTAWDHIPAEAWAEVVSLKDGRKKAATPAEWANLFKMAESQGWSSLNVEKAVMAKVAEDCSVNLPQMEKLLTVFASFQPVGSENA